MRRPPREWRVRGVCMLRPASARVRILGVLRRCWREGDPDGRCCTARDCLRSGCVVWVRITDSIGLLLNVQSSSFRAGSPCSHLLWPACRMRTPATATRRREEVSGSAVGGVVEWQRRRHGLAWPHPEFLGLGSSFGVFRKRADEGRARIERDNELGARRCSLGRWRWPIAARSVLDSGHRSRLSRLGSPPSMLTFGLNPGNLVSLCERLRNLEAARRGLLEPFRSAVFSRFHGVNRDSCGGRFCNLHSRRPRRASPFPWSGGCALPRLRPRSSF